MKIIHSLFVLIAPALLVLSGCKSTTTPEAMPATGIYAPVPKHDPVIKGDYITADKADTKPQPILPLTPPEYPAKLKRARASGSALIAFIIMPDGSTAQVQAVEATYRGFADAAVECVKEWNYKPAIKDGKRVNCLMMVPIAFYPPSPKDDKFVPSDSKPATTPKAVPTTGIYAPVPKHDPVITGDYITVDKADVRPVPQFRDKLPPYPPELKGISGRAKVAFIVTTDGSTAQVQAVEATHRGFADAAEECFKKPRFKPAIKDGKTVNCLMILPMGFVQTSVDGKTEDFIILETPHLHAAP